MIASLLVIALSLLPGFANAQALETLQWKKRALVLFDKSRSGARLDKQLDLFRLRRPDVRDRDLVVIVNPGQRETFVGIGYASLPRGANRMLRSQFSPAGDGLTVILVGKDGLEKGRWQTVVQPDEVFELIDQMPMRKQEIKEADS